MSSDNHKITSQSCWHGVSWLAGILALLVPFLAYWEFGATGNRFTLRQGVGHFGDNAMIGTMIAAIGAMLGGYWWGGMQRLSKGKTICSQMAALALLVFSGLGLMGYISQSYYFYGLAALILAGLVLARKIGRSSSAHYQHPAQAPARINFVYFLLLCAVLVLNNAVAIISLDITGWEKTSAILGRVFFYVGITALFCLFIKLVLRATPKRMRFIPWTVLGILPFIAFADMWLRVSLKRTIHGFTNNLTGSGEFNLKRELAAGDQGLEFSSSQCLMALILFIAAAALLAYLCGWISQKKSSNISLKAVAITALAALNLNAAEQGIGSQWKSLSARQNEYKALSLHLGFFAPRRGVALIRVEFANAAPLPTKLGKATSTPDIYVFMVETFRGDALRKDVTPFLYEFSQTDCQPVARGCSGSNATHLSWFSMMHSKIPVYWRKSLEDIPNPAKYAGAPPLQWLKNSGYRIEIRAVCDLEYKSFGLLNFGSGGMLADLVEHSVDGTEYAEHNTPEREVIAIDRLQKSLTSRPAGGGFYYTALDTPHYGYYWLHGFEPPFKDYIENASFPLIPSTEETQLYKQRYWNACAWVDHQLKEFCDFLKMENRYDDAIIIVIGDHGEEFQEHGGWCHCSSVFPEQVEVPILVKWPKSAGRGPSVRRASHLDIMPSVLSYLGAPQPVLDSMTGVDMRDPSQADHSIISTTSYAGGNGETMVIRRGDYAAFFSWPQYWLAEIPEHISLERIELNGKPISLANEVEYRKKLQELFPDALENYFSTFEVVPTED